ncbi:hypothetical protein GMORB2_3948 [Geosmithia morbida]|uniref:Uncharacterized protein n=1 Tax=Geosmithia morbida TaxID=1094350 RepID=A0A9P4Z0D3_9HYPO|nr:uncharacterized protein GMORB2_3948 [Geosmithia morbida]KAF4125109.1 hypothetical protein GMORB2_3948 [Geosmithia morbida]
MKTSIYIFAVTAFTSLVSAAPMIGPAKVDAILKGEMDPSECCSYGVCKGDVVISVG